MRRPAQCKIPVMNFNSRIDKFLGKVPALAPSAFVAANATLIGDVTLGGLDALAEG